ncbi:MAG: hypothetical protein H0U64_13680 [Gemmatimonadaceae bacterium]|nr:hypothetical protein [Gemmatimonadaceae bacterium]
MAFLFIAALGGAAELRALTPPSQVVSISSRNQAAVRSTGSHSVSLVFAVRNNSNDSITVVPGIKLPDGWSVVMGGSSFRLGPNEVDQWIIGIGVPARASAAKYTVRVSARVGEARLSEPVRDSAVILVEEKRGLAMVVTSRPAYAVGGDSYQVVFQLRNTGNMPANVSFGATSSLSGGVRLAKASTALTSNQSTTITVDVPASRLNVARDEIVELTASDADDSRVTACASARVTVVLRPGSEVPYETIPAQLRLRAAPKGSGVSPFEFTGRGLFAGSEDTQMDFSIRGRSSGNSVFGERDEYRVSVRNPRYTARVGDNLFMLSRLTGGGQPGFGAGVEAIRGEFSGGGYIQRFRFLPEKISERAGFVRLRPAGLPRVDELSANLVQRTGGLLAGNVASSAITAHPVRNVFVEAELAASAKGRSRGNAQSLHATAGEAIRFDVSHTSADSAFAGPGRGSQSDYASVSATPLPKLALSASANFNRFSAQNDSALPGQKQYGGSFQASVGESLIFGFNSTVRADAGEASISSRQKSGSVRLARSLGVVGGSASFEAGQVRDTSAGSGRFLQLRLAGDVNLRIASLSLFSDFLSGRSLWVQNANRKTFGGNGIIRLPVNSRVSIVGFTARTSAPSASSYSQVDMQFVHTMRNGSTIGVRGRFASRPRTDDGFERTAYMEYGLPLRVPVGKTIPRGSVQGIVQDEATGRAISGALVRLGPQAAVTDKKGNVRFTGLAAGEYRVSLAHETSSSNLAYTGDQVIRVDSTGRKTRDFRVRVGQASKVAASVRQFTRARTSLVTGPDSLVDFGPVEGALVSLILDKDTLFQTTGANGKVLFEDLPKGSWTVQVLADPPTPYRYEKALMVVAAEAGKESAIEFRLVPRQKTIQIIAGDRSVTEAAQPVR